MADLEICMLANKPPSTFSIPKIYVPRKRSEPLPHQPKMSMEEALRLAANSTPEAMERARRHVEYILAFPRRRRRGTGAAGK